MTAAESSAVALDHLDVTAIRRRMVSEVVGTHIYIFGDVASTNAVLRGLADAGAQEGTVVLAEVQQAACGHGDAAWFSPPGVNLYASVLFRSGPAPVAVPLFTCMTLIALTDTLRGLGLRATIRWPNDVMVGGRKIGIVRLEPTSTAHHVPYVVVGVRVNVNVRRAELEEGLGPVAAVATSACEELRGPIDRNAFAAAFLTQLETELRLLREMGARALVRAWAARDALRGRRVEVTDDGGIFTGRVDGIDTRGDLVVITDHDGRRRHVEAGALRVLELLA
jgi:BirA family biotin operon repressor/biotin-[acetyl-CoA-carboxylase] ligase